MADDRLNTGVNGDRAMREIVSLDAWYGKFDRSRATHLRAHVGFKSAEFSTRGEYGTIRFTVHLSEARLGISIPPTEPLRIDRDRVFSGSEEKSVTRRRRASEESARDGEVGARIGVGSRNQGYGVARATAHRSSSTSATIESETKFGPIAVKSWHHEGVYCWILQPSEGHVLDGAPWVRAQPLLRLIRTDSPRSQAEAARSQIDTAIYVEVFAKRDHLKIDITGSEDGKASLRDRMTGKMSRNNLAAAEACVRNAIIAEGLDITGFEDPNALVTLARMLASGPQK